MPYLGFPYSWKSVLSTLTGLALIGLSYAMYQEHQKDNTERFDNFRENVDFKKAGLSDKIEEGGSPEEAS